MKISIIIPAHNEEKNLMTLLPRLIDGDDEFILDVIVVCNACTDNTVSVCKKFSSINIIVTDVPSKINALNLGDKVAKYFPRFYLDADIILSRQSLINTAIGMNKNGALACSPKMTIDFKGRPWIIQTYYKIWLETPYCQNGMLGSGIYGVSKEGRTRFQENPKIEFDLLY